MLLVLKHLFVLFSDLLAYSWVNENWWSIPVVLILLAVGILAVTSQVTAPYIYTLF